MFSKLKKSNTKGFTIIEVMIVLAIAGLILLIVFLAVPALQRNARNTSRKSDAGRISSAISNFVSNSNGTVPASIANLNSIMTDVNVSQLGEYNHLAVGSKEPAAMAAGTFNVTSGAIAKVPSITVSSTGDAVELDTGAQCDSANPGQTVVGNSSQQMAILYTLEPGSGTTYTIGCLNI